MATSTIKREFGSFYVKSDASNNTSYSFTIPSLDANYFTYILFWGGWDNSGTGDTFLGMIVHLSATTVLEMLKDTPNRTFSASVSGKTLTITANATLWGGLRVLAIN